MKLTKNTYTKSKPGVTLIELTVVILVLLTLIGVLFIGAQIYKRGADRAACILNIRNVHQAVRAEQNLTGAAEGTDVDLENDIYATTSQDNYLATPICPTEDGGYETNSMGDFPEVGTAAIRCTDFDPLEGDEDDAAELDHAPESTNGW